MQYEAGPVVALGQMWGDKVFHFMVETLARWASLPTGLRAAALDPGGPSASARARGRHQRRRGGVKVHVGPDLRHSAGSARSSHKRQQELLALVGVPYSNVVTGVVRAAQVIVPSSVTCGTPTHHQVSSPGALP